MRPLFTLPLPSIVISTLGKAGYHNCEDLFQGDIVFKLLEERKKTCSVLEALNINFDHIKGLMQCPGSIKAAQLLRNEQMNETIPTFSEALDKILGGGVHVGSILEICGPPGSGKTQLALQLCVNVNLPGSLDGLESESVFIDTESTFSVNRLREISTGAWQHCRNIAASHNLKDGMENFTTDSIMSGVHYIGTWNISQFMAAIHSLYELIPNNKKIKCIVIDSFTFPFLRISNNLDRTRYISITIQNLHELSVKYNVSVVLTNHLTTKINQESKSLVPSLGESLSHSIPNILLLGKVDHTFSAVMYKSSKLAEEVVLFKAHIAQED